MASTGEDFLFHTIKQLAILECTLDNILEGVKSKATHVSFFCREYWGTSASMAQLKVEEIDWDDRLRCHVRQACIFESLSLAVTSHWSSGTMQNIPMPVRLKLRKLIYNVHDNCLLLLDLVRQRWVAARGRCPHNLDFGILERRCRVQNGDYASALVKNNEAIADTLRALCQRASSPDIGSSNDIIDVLRVVGELLQDEALDKMRARTARSSMLQKLTFQPLGGAEGGFDQDPYDRYGRHRFARSGTGAVIFFEPLPPMIADLDTPLRPLQEERSRNGVAGKYTLVLDLDETLVHSPENGTIGARPGCREFLHRMASLGYELVIFTTATQDYADRVVNHIDPEGLIHHRLYRQHTLPWGPVYIKDLSRIGRELDRIIIIDNISDNFMLQPQHGITIADWFDDPMDTALTNLAPLLDELINTRARVPDILNKYAEQIPGWAGMCGPASLGGSSVPKGFARGRNGSNGSHNGISGRANGTQEHSDNGAIDQAYSQPLQTWQGQTGQQCQGAPVVMGGVTYVPVLMQVQPWPNMAASQLVGQVAAPANVQALAEHADFQPVSEPQRDARRSTRGLKVKNAALPKASQE